MAFQAFGQYHINFNSQLQYFVFWLACMINCRLSHSSYDRLGKTTGGMAELRNYRMLFAHMNLLERQDQHTSQSQVPHSGHPEVYDLLLWFEILCKKFELKSKAACF
jgi:hypothetical protein